MVRKHALIFLCLLAVLALFSCSNKQAVALRYQAEKMYFLVDRDMHLAENQGPASNETLRKWADQYRELARFCFSALKEIDSSHNPVEHEEVRYYAIQGATRVAQMYYAAGRYDTSIVILSDLLRQVSMSESQHAATVVNLGEALQADGQWDSAFAMYHEALSLKPTPLDDSGNVLLQLFNLPAHMYSMQQLMGDSAQLAKHYHEAETYYRGFISDMNHPHLVALSRAALARLYDGAGDWPNVLDQLNHMTDSSHARLIEIQIGIAEIYGEHMRMPDRALNMYDSLLNNLQEADSLARPYIQYKIALVQLGERKYDDARNTLVALKRNFERFYSGMPPAQLAFARTFELEGNWDRAVTEYRSLVENYRGSDEGMQGYVHVASTLDSMGRAKEAELWYKDAEKYIDEIATRAAGTLTEARALYFKSLLYEEQHRWADAAQTLLQLFQRFPDSDAGRQSIVRASTLYLEKLNDQAKSDSLFAVFKNSLSRVHPGWEAQDQLTNSGVQ